LKCFVAVPSPLSRSCNTGNTRLLDVVHLQYISSINDALLMR